jgi:hypothetical protein
MMKTSKIKTVRNIGRIRTLLVTLSVAVCLATLMGCGKTAEQARQAEKARLEERRHPVVDCNDCDPPLSEVYIVKLRGLLEPWAPWNGRHVLTWDAAHGSCTWVDDTGKLKLYFYGAGWWLAVAPTSVDELKWFYLGDDDCDPLGFYNDDPSVEVD